MMTRTAFLHRLGALEALTQRREQAVPDALTLMHQAGLVPDAWQQQVLVSQSARLLLLCCRQSGKSLTCACLALATAVQTPGSLVLVLSPSLRQSQETFRKILDLYRPVAGSSPAHAESTLRLELQNGSRIVSLPGTEHTVRGYSGVTLLIVDEAARVPDALYFSVRPMLAISQGRMVCLSTPFGRRGWFYQEWSGGAMWERVMLTAPQCPRIPAQFLEDERRSLPDLWYKSEYMCEFCDTVDMVFRSEDVEAAVTDTVRPLFAR